MKTFNPVEDVVMFVTHSEITLSCYNVTCACFHTVYFLQSFCHQFPLVRNRDGDLSVYKKC